METFFLAFGATLFIGVGTGIVLAILYPRIRSSLLKQQPHQRADALLGWAIAPLCIGLFFTSLLFVPSLLNRLGIPAGHCHNHAERLPHICLTSPPLTGSEAIPGLLALVLLGLIAVFLLSQAGSLLKGAQFKRMLRTAIDCGKDYQLIPWNKPAAFTAGFWSPQIFISNALTDAVSPEHLKIILAHEKEHVRRRDSLRQHLAKTFSVLLFPSIRRLILEDLTLATEQACDETAASISGDHLQVAGAIIAVERLLQNPTAGSAAGAVGFVKNNSEQRIHSLLAEGCFKKPLFPCWLLVLPLLIVALLLMPGAAHSLIEYIISA